MADRQTINRRPQIIFIHSKDEVLPAHARRVARQHASWWGHRRSRMRDTVKVSKPDSPSSSISSVESTQLPDNPRSTCPERRKDMVSYLLTHNTSPDPYLGTKIDSFAILPQLFDTATEPKELASIKHEMCQFFGDSFLRKTILRTGEPCENRYAGCLLLYYAYRLAITGKGSCASLMTLKGAVIRKVNIALADPGQSRSLDTMIAVLALGIPMVCQLTNTEGMGRPGRTWDTSSNLSLNCTPGQSQEDENLEAPYEQSISREYDMHYRAITKLMLMQPDPAFLTTPDGRFIFLTKVFSSAHRMLTMPISSTTVWVELFQKFELFSLDTQLDSRWYSPLFCPQRFTSRMTIDPEVPTDLVQMMQIFQKWFQMYQSGNNDIVAETGLRRFLSSNRLSNQPDMEATLHSLDVHKEWLLRYEACRIVINLMADAAQRSCSIREAAEWIPSVSLLPRILRKTDIAHLWGPGYCGLLYWVTLICHIVTSRASPEHLVSTLVLAHFTQKLSAEQIPPIVALRPIKEMLAFPRRN